MLNLTIFHCLNSRSPTCLLPSALPPVPPPTLALLPPVAAKPVVSPSSLEEPTPMSALSALLVLTPLLVPLPAPNVLPVMLSPMSALSPTRAPLVSLEPLPLLAPPIAAPAHLECKLNHFDLIIMSFFILYSSKPSSAVPSSSDFVLLSFVLCNSIGTKTLDLRLPANLALPAGPLMFMVPPYASSAPLEDLPFAVLEQAPALLVALEVVVPSPPPWQVMPLLLDPWLASPTLLFSAPALLLLLSSPLPWTRPAPWRSVPWL
jgi:hypothetical protein